MFGTAIVIFREVLEAALIIGVIASATRTIAGRGRFVVGGIAAGVLGATVVALGTERIALWADGIGQEVLNATVLGIAVLMLAWHVLWMSSHGAKLAADARSVGTGVASGRYQRSVILVVVALAVLREGAEAVLFLYGIAASGESSVTAMLAGGLAGLAAGAGVGVLVYAGLLRIPLRWFFAATNVLVVFLAAGMAAQCARFLVQGDLLPSLASPVWDTSRWLPQDSVPGALLHGLVGYDARPSGMQFVFYLGVLATLVAGMRYVEGKSREERPAGEAPAP